MVKFRSWMESRCMAMQLALCLLIGLRLVSASLHQSTCGLRKTTTSASSQRDTTDQHRIAPPTSKWSVEMLGSLSSDSKAEHHRNSTEKASPDTKMAVREAAGMKRSLKSDTNSCRPEGSAKHRIDAKDHLPPCPPDIATDFVSDPGSTHVSATPIKQTPSESGNNISSSFLSNPSLSPTSESILGSSLSDSSSSAGSGSSDLNALSSASPSSSLLGSSSSTSSNSNSPLAPSPTDPDPPAPMSSSLPNINYGTSNDNTSSPSSTPNQSPTNSTLSNGTLDSPTDQAPPSQTKTTAVAVGVTVPIGVIALGLVALAVLHKQRQRRKKMQSVQSVQGARDEEMADTPATQQATLKLPVQDAARIAPLATSAAPSQVAATPQEEPEESDQESNASHTTALSQPVPPVPSSSHAHESRSSPTQSTRSVGAVRGNTLKRKPVPALLETFEPATRMSPHAAMNASQDEEAASLPLPGTSEAASSVGHSQVGYTGASL